MRVRPDGESLTLARRQQSFHREGGDARLRFQRSKISAVIDLGDERRAKAPRLLE